MMKAIISSLLLILYSSTAYSAESIAETTPSTIELNANIISYGIYAIIQEGYSERTNAGVSITGVNSQQLLMQTDSINAQLETVIGFEFSLSDSTTSPQELLTFITTPPKAILNPNTGKFLHSIVFTRTIEQARRNPFLGYRYEQPEECIDGIWRFQVLYRDKVIAEKQLFVNFDK